jgi:hypothetical protein
MNPFENAWSLLKEDNSLILKASLYERYDYKTLRKAYEDEPNDFSEPPMDLHDQEGMINPDYEPQNEKEARILQHYREQLGVHRDLSPEMMGLDGEEHQMRQDIAQEYFVDHMQEMNAKKTGISARDSVAVQTPESPVGQVKVE